MCSVQFPDPRKYSVTKREEELACRERMSISGKKAAKGRIVSA